MRRVGITGLVQIQLPDEDPINLTDGGFLKWGSAIFASKHETFGVVGSVSALTEGVDDEVPALELTMIPASTAAAADLSQPGFQRSQVRFWLPEFDIDTGAIVDDPTPEFEGQIDQTTLTAGRQTRELTMSIVSTGERLFERNIGNSLSAGFHKKVWPGETGHDQATGLGQQIAWGVEAPPATTNGYYGGGTYAGGGGMTGRSSFGYIAL